MRFARRCWLAYRTPSSRRPCGLMPPGSSRAWWSAALRAPSAAPGRRMTLAHPVETDLGAWRRPGLKQPFEQVVRLTFPLPSQIEQIRDFEGRQLPSSTWKSSAQRLGGCVPDLSARRAPRSTPSTPITTSSTPLVCKPSAVRMQQHMTPSHWPVRRPWTRTAQVFSGAAPGQSASPQVPPRAFPVRVRKTFP